MVDYPSNAPRPVLAFVGPADPQAAARAAQAASRALDDLFNPKPRVPKRLPGRYYFNPLAGVLADCVIAPLLPPVYGVGDDCPLSVTTVQETTAFDDAGWTKEPCRGRTGAYAFHNSKTCSSSVATCMTLSQENWTPWHVGGNRYVVRTFDGTASCGVGKIYMFRYDGFYKDGWQVGDPSPEYVTVNEGTYGRPAPFRRAQAGDRVTGTGGVRLRPPTLTTARRPAKKREREAPKQSWTAGAFPFRKLLEGAFETVEALQAVHDALPPHLQCRGAIGSPIRRTAACMADAVLEHYKSVDWSRALENLVDAQVEDFFFGQLGRLTAREARAVGRARGIQARPSTRYGGWTPCVFCN